MVDIKVTGNILIIDIHIIQVRWTACKSTSVVLTQVPVGPLRIHTALLESMSASVSSAVDAHMKITDEGPLGSGSGVDTGVARKYNPKTP